MGKIMLNDIEYGSGGSGDANEQELTLAEYNELSPAEKMNGTNYFITDAVPEGKEIQPVIYSENEREIGVWVDGKPLYQKTIDCGALPNATTKNVAHGISNISADTIVNIIGIAQYSGHYAIGLPKVHDQNVLSQIMIEVDDTNIIIYSRSTDESAYVGHVTLQYTKTTDTAGSGVWTPSGVPAVHYSTDEQIIGTWMGETLYQKTLIYTGSIVLNDSSWTTIPFTNVPNTDYCMATVVVTDCIFDNRVRLQIANGEIKGATSQGSGQTITDMAVTIQYTKSTS